MSSWTEKHHAILGYDPQRSVGIHMDGIDIGVWKTPFLPHEHPSLALKAHQPSRASCPQDT
jgi:hypothetical protein